ncbi:MAG: head decoration protein [Desulfurellales bacterium]|nr:MAG: head decoration protein [Desulfurellales bacterium]
MALNETNHALEFLLSEAPGSRSREEGTLNTGQDLVAGAVVGRILSAAGEKISGTGDGTIGSVTLGSAAQTGVYVLRGIAESGNAGTFSVTAPDGTALPNLTVAAAYASSHINLTVADGANDWDIGDLIYVTVTGGDYEALDPAATTGEQTAIGILCYSTDATSADQKATFIVRDAEVAASRLIWPEGISDADKALATSRLAAAGITLRS